MWLRLLRYGYLSPRATFLLTVILCVGLTSLLVGAAYVLAVSTERPATLDRSRLGALAFSEDFSHGLGLYDEDRHVGRWRTQYLNDGIDSRASRTHGEAQCYVDPKFAGLGLQPFHIRPDKREGDVLQITLDRAPAALQRACYGSPYGSGMISSQPSFAMTDGYWEIRAKMPRPAPGVWPAIWLLPEDGTWPPEIDIVEMAKGVLNSTLHSSVTGEHVADGTSHPELGDLSAGFHTFGLLKTGEEIVWYLDDKEVKRVPASYDLGKPFYIIINLAMGQGGWVGDPGPNSTPALLEIASIRAYRLK